VWERYAIYNRH